MNIGIDIDGVVNDLSLFHIACGTKFCFENNISFTINEHAMDSRDIFSWGGVIDNIFWENYYLKLLLYPDFVRSYVAHATHILRSYGHKLFIISARKDSDLPYFEKRTMFDLTEMYLHNCKINYNELFLNENKWQLIKRLNIHLMIEDDPLFFLSSQASYSMPLMCFSTPYNQNIFERNVIRVYSWYDILSKIKKEEGTYEY